KFGRRYYHFTYKGVLFLCLFTDEPPGSSSLSKEQIAWAKKVLAENPSPRWTVVAMHKPIWAYGDLQKSGWLEVEEALAGRPYTVFAGHVHRYQKFIRNGMNYYMLATTGGVSRMRGIDYGEFDHVVWVTMKDDGPRLANLLLDGILPEDLRVPETEEPAAPRQELKTYPVRGTAYLDGVPAYGTGLNFTLKDPKTGRLRPMGNARVQPDGTFEVTTYRSFDGAPAGEYVVTFHPVGGFPGDPPTPPEVEIPAKYRDVKTSPLRAEVKADAENEFIFELTR
ncbi:MAG TPA: hypothetical protein VIL46_11925, partial [Gemmataceae bacterium]